MIGGRFLSLLVACLVSASAAGAQSFFTNLGTDPSTGVDRGSASVIRKVETRTRYLTFSSIGADEIGPYIASATLAWPNLVRSGDQLDLVLVLGGLADNGGLELAAAGLGYRQDLAESGITLYFNGDHGEYALGSAASRALDIGGSQTNAAIGIRKVWTHGEQARLTGSLELALRDSQSEILGATFSEERLRMLRAALRYERGVPFLFQQRYGLSVTKGLDAIGASPSASPIASAPGVTTDFLRAAFSAEASVPLSMRFVVNAGVVGQWTNDSLPVSQRCGYGTNAYARGFDQSYVNGDRCVGTRVELAYNIVLPDPRARVLDLRQAYIGIDGGSTEDLANPFQAGNTDRWSSVSAGIRMARGDFIGEISATHILDRPAGAFPQDDTRLWFQAGFRF